MTRYKCTRILGVVLQTLVLAQSCFAKSPTSSDMVQPAQAAGDPSASSPITLVREVVYNELHDHDSHGYWRYWIEKHRGAGSSLEEQVESPDGPVTRTIALDGKPVSTSVNLEEDHRLAELLESPAEQAEHRKAYAEDERRISRILALLPDAFLYEPQADQRLGSVTCHHLRFHPNPAYPAHSIEARIFHAMQGDLWIGADSKRLVRLEGVLQENVDFGYGILGRLYKGGWFRLERTEAGAGGGMADWKTQRLEVHMQGRAMLFKTIARETSELRGGFTPVPQLTLQQAVNLVRADKAVAANTHSEAVSLQHP